MEKRLGVVAILVKHKKNVGNLNSILSSHSDIILGRLGLPLRDKGVQVISLIVEGTTDRISSLTGRIGKLDGIQVKSVLTSYKEKIDENSSEL